MSEFYHFDLRHERFDGAHLAVVAFQQAICDPEVLRGEFAMLSLGSNVGSR